MEPSDSLMEEKKLLAETKYRNYMTNIDKALRNFEYSSEWADLISALGKLSKAISGNTQYQLIPRRIKISKRLAQCMHPNLPSGVHLKALETYAVIFSKTGPERLATELFIYSAGLFPLLGYAAMNVRPALLGIYETHFVPLGEKLRPALSGFLSGVLPGYENGLDHFDRTSSLLKQVCSAVNSTHFYTVLWECVATNALIRLPAITYLLDHFNKRLGMKDQLYIMGNNHDIMMSGLCASLNDTQILVQRNALEFLLLGFPMHTNYLKEEDLIKLVTNGLNTILRRDMSLNRRLYSWLLGSEISKNSPPNYDSHTTILDANTVTETETYFQKHSKNIIIQAVIRTLKYSFESTPVDLKPYKIMVSLLDKAEIGSAVLDFVLCDIIRAMSLSSGNVEVMKSANLLFATFEPAYIWSFMTIMYERSCDKAQKNRIDAKLKIDDSQLIAGTKIKSIIGSGEPCLVEICFLTEFLLENISLEMYNETTRLYLPKVFLAITQMLTINLEKLSSDEISASLKLCMKIVSRVQPIITSPIKIVPRQSNSGLSSDEKPMDFLLKNATIGPANVLLEKSKSDSKLNQLSVGDKEPDRKSVGDPFNFQTDDSLQRSHSNQNIERKKSPKKKKAKSYSKLSELDKEICPDTGQLIDAQQSSSDMDTPLSIKKLKSKNKHARSSPRKNIPNDTLTSEPETQTDAKINLPNEYNDSTKTTTTTTMNDLLMYGNTSDIDENCPNLEEYSILEKCIRQYEIFFEIFWSYKLLGINFPINNEQIKRDIQHDDYINVENFFKNDVVFEKIDSDHYVEINKLFDTLKMNTVSRTIQLQSLLSRSLVTSDSASDSEQREQQMKNLNQKVLESIERLVDLRLTDSLRSAIKLAANLLVELSTFPNCNRKNILLDKSEKEVPSWLKVLSLTACYIQNDADLQLAAITTLFDLISLLKSQIEHTTSPGVTFVVMVPLLKFGHVHYIEQKTRVFQLITSNLWNYLGEANVDPSQITLLLYQLHNCLDSGLVERIIGYRMYSHHLQQPVAMPHNPNDEHQTAAVTQKLLLRNYRYDRAADLQFLCVLPDKALNRELKENESKSLKKFELLWHLGRDKHSTKCFEKTLLNVLDRLALPYYMSVHTFVTKWLQSSLLRGDLSRLLKPLYKILLSSQSKRIGIIHIQNLMDGDEKNALIAEENSAKRSKSNLENDVYGISSEYGNIKYHMDISNNKKRSPIKSIHKKIFGVAIAAKNKTANFVSDKTSTTVLQPDNATADTIGLTINPLDNSPDFEDELEIDEEDNAKMMVILPPPSSSHTNERKFSANQTDEEQEQCQNDIDYDQDLTDESETSIYDSETDNREASIEKDDSLTLSSGIGEPSGGGSCSNIKRFVGDCERVTEVLSQHEHTKNRKTYRLSHEKSTPDTSLISTANDDLFSTEENKPQTTIDTGKGSSGRDDSIQSFVNDLMEKASNNSTDSKKSRKSTASRLHNSKGKYKKLKKSISSSDKKRLSCISKTSTESSNSYGGTIDMQSPSTTLSDGIAQTMKSNSRTATTIIKTINVQAKRRQLVLETNKQIKDWEITNETLEKSKQNVEILRQSVSSSTTKNACSNKSSHSSYSSRNSQFDNPNIFHSYILIYMGIYDTKQTLYAFQTLRNIIACDTRTFLCLSITTSLSSSSVKQMLVRHRKSIAGKGFIGNISNTEFSQAYRGCMQLEVLVMLCLYYARGHFNCTVTDNNGDLPTREDVIGNCSVQLQCIELLTLICTELIDVVKSMGKGLACYIADLMARCKVQKVILHCLNLSVTSYDHHYIGDTLIEKILNFNNAQDDNLHAESFQVQLLRLLMAVIKLEYEVELLKDDVTITTTANSTASKEDLSNISPISLTDDAFASNVKYLPNCLISQQPMFLAAILNALQDERLRHLHRNWTDLVTSSLNCFNVSSLANIVISVVHQLCNNLDIIAKMNLKEQYEFPPDYIVSQLEAITILCHYCLLDNTQQTTLSHLFNQAYPQASVVSHNSNTGQLLNNLVHSFLSNSNNGNIMQSDTRTSQLLNARNAVLSHLSRIVASVASIWDSELGQLRPVKQQLMEFLSPISLHHGVNFLTAVAVTWHDRSDKSTKRTTTNAKSNGDTKLFATNNYNNSTMPQASNEQMNLVTLVSSIRVMPMDSFVQTLHQVVKSPPPIFRPPENFVIEVSALELFYFYMKSAPAPQLGDAWNPLLVLIRDGLNLIPTAQFVLLLLLNEFVQRCPQMPFQDKKDIRDLHDITSRLVDSLSNIAGSCLEQTTWLRRNLAVKEDIPTVSIDGCIGESKFNNLQQQYAVQAQSVLAVVLANLLDVAYGSQEKDKVVNIITTLLYNITPYLKNHTSRNIPSFYACSNLLASLSGYQYTRKAWRKDMLDLLLDTSFFQMDISCLPFWKQIMDSLMTYDNTTFRELMSRVSLTQTGSLNIFASREQEYEQRSMLLKRLAFVIFCSEFDQYHKYMPEIQEQLTNSLRLFSMVPCVQSAVFLCFRVLLLRMSPDHVTSLWPIIIAEMVQVFLAMEQELKFDGDDLSQQMRFLSGIDVSWTSNNFNNGINSQNHIFYWRSVQLEASKLLELGCVLPANNLPHFQMYRWAFVGTDAYEEITITNGNADERIMVNMLYATFYIPHIRRIVRLMDMKYAAHSPTNHPQRSKHLTLTCQQILSLQELYSFFSTLNVNYLNPLNYANTDREVNSCLIEIEEVLSKDFLESMTASTTPR